MSATTRPALTDRQAEILRWVGEYLAENLVPPTMREVMERFGFTSTNAVSCHVNPLRKKGYLEPAAGVLRSRGLVPAGLPREGMTWESETDGTGKWHLCTARPITWVDGRTVIIRIATDITRLKQLEANNQSIQAHLQQSQKMEAIGTLAGGIAHDFNNILTAVMGYTEIALMEVADGAPVRRNLEQVLQAGTRARRPCTFSAMAMSI